MYDLLIKGRELTKDEEQRVKLASKNLFTKLTSEKNDLFIVDWYKDEQASVNVKSAISKSLDSDLPVSYDKEALNLRLTCCITTL